MSSPQHPPTQPWTAPPPRPVQHAARAAGHSRGSGGAHEHTRLALIIALSIAVVSVLGAIVGWRAELHASKASRYEQDAVATSIAATQVEAEAEAAAAKAESKYVHYTKLQDQANELMPGACDTTSRSTLVQFDAGALCETRVQFSGYAISAYIKADGNFDTEKYANDYVTAAREGDPLDANVFRDQAETERHHEDNMLYLSVFLVLSLALLTLARLGKSVPSRLVLAIPGWLVLVGSAALLVAGEF
ncbi:MAG TPA: hypothetical protein VGH43_13020 [Jatrophihabitans sp.]